MKLDSIFKKLTDELKPEKIVLKEYDTGEVEEIKDGIAILKGLDSVGFGDLIEFQNGIKGMVVDLNEKNVAAIILGDYLKLKVGDTAYATDLQASVPVSEKLLGRVINSLGEPLDDLPEIKEEKRYPLERIAPGIVYRQSVNTPLQTGIKAIDSLIPIGRGQRELIIGDRGTGKTTIVLDTIINQKNEGVICIYCAIGQKSSKIAQVIDLLKKAGAMDYTVIVSASSSDPVSLQYLAPYSACAIAEYFMDKGKDVLVVYDDLTKHAWAYREISLILRRPAGREAYPGDIFYLHSRLLERACKLDDKYGGGSITALPIIETLEGDVSSYIPTNVISITDGQIFLENDLFNAGIRPAINVGISVSRVGGNAQTKAMKKVAGKLKLDLAQYREMVAFSQFESELDEETKKFLDRGARLTQFLIQKPNQPYSLALEVALIWAANSSLLEGLPLSQIIVFEERFIEILNKEGKDLIKEINKKKDLTEDIEKKLEILAKKTLESVKL
ncbi:MAG: F0F1 ATP synthase subunit alpha [Patescibacteria group bacterium]|nr:F0F1 ATP synthase subunit alpha [Patescibacteria group bacterium]